MLITKGAPQCPYTSRLTRFPNLSTLLEGARFIQISHLVKTSTKPGDFNVTYISHVS